MTEEAPKKLLKKMGVRFQNESLLELALTHRSFVHEHRLPLEASNERLEFLGDAVLGLCIAEMLVRSFPEETEGSLSKRRAALVNQKQLAQLAENLDLGAALRLGKGEEKTGGRKKKSLLCDAFEAVIGALYLDQGVEACQKCIEKLFHQLIPVSKKMEASQDYKTKLQEYFQQEYQRSPRYLLSSETGPDHLKSFEVRIEFNEEVLGSGHGRSKREAEQDAARNALNQLAVTGPPAGEKKAKKKKKKRRRKNPVAKKSEGFQASSEKQKAGSNA